MKKPKVQPQWEGEDEGRYPYPFVECDHHPGPQRGYMVCVCVASQNAVVYAVGKADDKNIGDVLCLRHRKLFENNSDVLADDLVLICEGCAQQHGILEESALIDRPVSEAVKRIKEPPQ